MGLVGLLEVRPHGCRRQVESEGSHHNEHGGGADVLEGQVTDKLGLDDCLDDYKVGMQVEHIADGIAGRDGGPNLAKVILGVTEEFLGFAVIQG